MSFAPFTRSEVFALRSLLALLLLLSVTSVAHAYEPTWVPGEGTHRHVPTTPRDRVRNGALVGLLGGAVLTVGTVLTVAATGADDVTVFATALPAGTLLLPLGASLGAAIAGRHTEGKFSAAFGWSLGGSLVTVGVPAGLGVVIAEDPLGAFIGGAAGLALDLFVAPWLAIRGYERSRKLQLAMMPLRGGTRLGVGGRF